MTSSRPLCAAVCILSILWLGTPATAGSAGPELKLTGTIPQVEQALLTGLSNARLLHRVVRIAADTNGRITVASVVFTYRATGPAILRDLQEYVWAVVRATFAAVPALAEVDLTGFHQGNGPFDGTRRDVTFSASVTAEEMARLGPALAGSAALSSLPRLWYYPALLASQARVGDLDRFAANVPPPLYGPERILAFSGEPEQRTAEAANQLTGRRAGGVLKSVLYRGNPSRRALALTFDDGPTPLYTPLLLDTLNRLGVKATFFLIGLRVQQYPYLAQAIVRAGHEIGNHSFHHVSLTKIPEAQLIGEIGRTQQVITAVTGQAPRYFRPPGGRYDPAVLRVARDLGLITVFWTDDPADYARPSPLVLEATLLGRVSNGGILLLHQGVGQTIQILPEAVAILQQRGFGITTVGGLLSTDRR